MGYALEVALSTPLSFLGTIILMVVAGFILEAVAKALPGRRS